MKSLCAALLLSAALLPAQVNITAGREKVSVSIDGKPFTDFYVAGPDVTKPYLHPLRAASGTYVTRMWPMEVVEGEPQDHKHQRGLWFAHAKVNGLDFWNNEASYTTPNRGRIALKKMGKIKNGKQQGSVAAEFEWTDSKGSVLLTESRTMTFYSDPKLRIIDFDIVLTGKTMVTFFDEKDGLFAYRIRPDLQEVKHSGKLVNAEGLETEKALWGKPSKWIDCSGEVKGEKLGIAVFDHPQNPAPPRSAGTRAATDWWRRILSG